MTTFTIMLETKRLLYYSLHIKRCVGRTEANDHARHSRALPLLPSFSFVPIFFFKLKVDETKAHFRSSNIYRSILRIKCSTGCRFVSLTRFSRRAKLLVIKNPFFVLYISGTALEILQIIILFLSLKDLLTY